MFTLLVSDLHLDSAHPATIKRFLNLLEGPTRQADAMYILGDLFEFWIGDDYVDRAYKPVIDGLKACTATGTPIYLMHGNRDFLLGDDFMQLTGCLPLTDPELVDLYGEPALLMHGDLLCTDDLEYQSLRKTVRNPAWQAGVLRKPVEERLAMARDARSLSSELIRDKPDAIMDVNQDAVIRVLKQYKARLLIHGHTHRQGMHEFTINNRAVRRIVLGDWYRQGNYLRISDNETRFESC